MKIGIHISLALIMALCAVAGLRACNPFDYLLGEHTTLKGGVER